MLLKFLNTAVMLNKAILQIWNVEKYSYQSITRPDYGFLYLAKGQLIYRSAGRTIRMRPGDIVYLPKHSNYEVAFDVKNGPVEDILINFDVVGNKAFAAPKHPVCFFNDHIGGLYHYFCDVVNAYYERGIAFRTNMLLNQCLDVLQETLYAEAEQPESAQLRHAAAMLSEDQDITIDAICEQLHTSRNVFQKRFKSYFGVAPAAYRIDKRIEKAKLLLETTDLPIQNLADQLGFYDVAYFYKVFKKYTALTPKQYREENKPYF